MSWQPLMTTLFRVMIMDMATPQTYADASLQQIILVAAQLIQIEMQFSQLFVPDIINLTLTPDPTVGETRDDSFINLCSMKATCILERGETRAKVGTGVLLRDPGNTIDTRAVGINALKLLEINFCKAYEDAKFEYLCGQVRPAGACIMGPIRIFSGMDSLRIPSGGYEGRSANFN
jgi:hypothetical protein